jgi:integrase
VNVLALQRMLGHKSAKITLDTYADLFDDDFDAVAESCMHDMHAK